MVTATDCTAGIARGCSKSLKVLQSARPSHGNADMQIHDYSRNKNSVADEDRSVAFGSCCTATDKIKRKKQINTNIILACVTLKP